MATGNKKLRNMPVAAPSPAMMNENSPIWARLMPDWMDRRTPWPATKAPRPTPSTARHDDRDQDQHGRGVVANGSWIDQHAEQPTGKVAEPRDQAALDERYQPAARGDADQPAHAEFQAEGEHEQDDPDFGQRMGKGGADRESGRDVRPHEQAGQEVAEHDGQAEALEDCRQKRRDAHNQRDIGERGRDTETGGNEKQESALLAHGNIETQRAQRRQRPQRAEETFRILDPIPFFLRALCSLCALCGYRPSP